VRSRDDDAGPPSPRVESPGEGEAGIEMIERGEAGTADTPEDLLRYALRQQFLATVVVDFILDREFIEDEGEGEWAQEIRL
jgi:hypothetical protein